jgi:hypothetical protein
VATKTYAQLGVETTVAGSDLIATWRGSGPLKTVTGTVAKTFFESSSLLLDGSSPMTGALELADGTEALPGLTFASDLDLGLYRVGANSAAFSAGGVRQAGFTATGFSYHGESVLAKSANYTAVKADASKLINCTSTFTLALDDVAALGDGWWIAVRNNGTGVITIDPDGSETIDGQASLSLYPGASVFIYATASALVTVGGGTGGQSGSITSGDTEIIIPIPTSADGFEISLSNILSNAGAPNMVATFSIDGGATYKTGATDYIYALRNEFSNATGNNQGGTSPSVFVGSIAAASTDQLSGGFQFNTATNRGGTMVGQTGGRAGSLLGNYMFTGSFNAFTDRVTHIRLSLSSNAFGGGKWAVNPIRGL